jgi:hypothetical protein
MSEEVRKERDFNKLTRLMISGHDFQQALSAATFLLEDVDETEKYSLAQLRRFRCFETAMVIAYARPFSMAKGKVGALKWIDVGLAKNGAERSLHEKLIKHRNTIGGHSDAEFINMRVMLMHQYFDHNDVDFSLIMPRFDEGMRFTLVEIGTIHAMLHNIINNLFFQFQERGVEFRDRFATYEMNIETSARRVRQKKSKRETK